MSDGIPLVTVVTPTWLRHDLLLGRCIPSVQAQGYPAVEHLIIGDGPDPWLSETLARPWESGWRGVGYRELAGHDPRPHYGHLARAAGCEHAAGAYIAYCDDDDALRPDHCGALAAALDAHPWAGFAVSRMVSHNPYGDPAVIGFGPLACGNVGTPMVMHRREALDGLPGWDHASQFEDWEFVLAMMNAGIKHVRVDTETIDVWPSTWR